MPHMAFCLKSYNPRAGKLSSKIKGSERMPWQADGSFVRLYSWNADANAGFDIMSGRMDSDTNDIAQGIARCRSLDGFNQPSVNLPMGGFKHTGVALATNPTDYARFDQVMPIGGGTFTGPVSCTTITATGVTVNGNETVSGTLHTSGAASLSGGAAVTGGLTADNATVNGNQTVSGTLNTGALNTGTLYSSAAASLSGGATVTGGLTVDNATVNGNQTVVGNLYADGAIVAPSGHGGLKINNGCVVTADAGAQVGLQVDGEVAVTVYGAGDGRVDAAGGYYVSGTPHMLADRRFGSLFRALEAAPDGASLVITKTGGEFIAQAIGLAPRDAQGRRSLFVQETP
jgi:hypothetical protein